MSEQIDILAIDDDKFLHKVIAKTLDSEDMAIRFALNGEAGIQMAAESVPDIILLDVEMPGINGYETCEKLRATAEISNVPIIFLSSHSSLRERMQGYEAGGDDYLVKPFEAENLKARVNILIGYQQERLRLEEQYQFAQKTAVEAMTGTSELGLAMQFLEKSITFNSVEELIKGLFDSTNRFELDCCAMVQTKAGYIWFTSKQVISPIEKELLEMSDRDQRFLDFGQRTICNYPLVSLLVRKMPLDNSERYGRLKDLLPILLSAVNVKLGALETRFSLNQQSQHMLDAFKGIRSNLYFMGKTIVDSRGQGQDILSALVQELHADLLGMGLEQDQEDYLIDRIDSVLDEVMEKLDAGAEISGVLNFILNNLKSLVQKQEMILEEFSANLATHSEVVESDDGIELF